MKVIKYSPSLDIRNTEQLPHGTGAKFLECLESHISNVLIAVQFRRIKKLDSPEHVLIEF